jgi:hypothetical protein
VGLSAGTGQPPDFVPSDFIGYGSCPVMQPVLVPGSYSRSTNGNFQLTLAGALGSECDILCSTNLQDWRVLATIQITNTPSVFVDTNTTLSHCFYRARLVP